MRTTTLLLALAAIVLAFSMSSNAQPRDGKKVLYHVVSFKFKPEAKPEQIEQVVKDFIALKEKIPTIQSLTCGANNSPEKLNKGFTHCFILTFADEKARDEYLPHPAHKAFGKSLGPVLADVFVIDFWGEK